MVVSPAKKLGVDGSVPCCSHTVPQYQEQAQLLIDLLREKDSFEIAELMKLSMNLADLNVTRYRSWRSGAGGKQALWLFRGDVYRSMDADSFDDGDIAFAQSHLRILSGLYGLLRPLDMIQPHRLEMGTRLSNPRGANLYAFWGHQISHALNKALEQQGDNWLINLASSEYFKAVQAKSLLATVVTPVFKERKRGGYKVIAIHAKRARGAMARYIIRHRLRHPDDLRSFDVDGYQWCAARSDDRQMVFVRG